MLLCTFAALTNVSAQPFTRSISPFPVTDEAGAEYSLPFLGGFNVPRPQLVDIDADGDADLFVQEKSDQIIFFENLGIGADFPFEWKTDLYQDLDVGQWYRFADIDADGDFDLLAEQSFSFIRFYRNMGGPENPIFEPVTDSLKDSTGEAIFSDRQNIPNISDIDCDGNVDLFIGRLDGTISHYERDGDDERGIPVFAFREDRFGGVEIIGATGKNSDDDFRHGANTLAFVDIDGDGDEDIFWGDFFEPGLLLLENQGSCQQPSISLPASFPQNDPIRTSGYNAPAFADVNLDGRLDLVVGVLGGAFSASSSSADNLLYYQNNLDDSFTLQSSRFLSNIDVGSDSFPVLVDWDGDGDLDLVVSNSIDPSDAESSHAVLYENTGTLEMPAFRQAQTLDLVPAFNYAPAFADLDADGDLDMLVGSWQGPVAFYRNEGTRDSPEYTLVDTDFLTWPGGSNSTPAIYDIDEDGDLDVLAGEGAGTLNFFRNTGSATNPIFMLESENYAEIDAGRRSVPVFYDLDDDGVEELVLGSDQGGIQTFRSAGSAEMPQFEAFPFFDLPAPPQRAAPALGDLDNDGDPDIMLGLLEGGLLYFENQLVVTSVDERHTSGREFSLEVYPNPFSDVVNVAAEVDEPISFELVIYDALGRATGHRVNGVMMPPNFSFQIDLWNLPAGAYFGRMMLGSGRAYVLRLIRKNHPR